MGRTSKQEEIREGLYTLRFVGRYGKSYKLSYPDVDRILSYLHKQGEWYVRGENLFANHAGICKLNPNIKEWEANAQLIAAAPDLYEACKVALWHEDNGEYESQKQGKPRLIEVLEILRKALAKAEGRE